MLASGLHDAAKRSLHIEGIGIAIAVFLMTFRHCVPLIVWRLDKEAATADLLFSGYPLSNSLSPPPAAAPAATARKPWSADETAWHSRTCQATRILFISFVNPFSSAVHT